MSYEKERLQLDDKLAQEKFIYAMIDKSKKCGLSEEERKILKSMLPEEPKNEYFEILNELAMALDRALELSMILENFTSKNIYITECIYGIFREIENIIEQSEEKYEMD